MMPSARFTKETTTAMLIMSISRSNTMGKMYDRIMRTARIRLDDVNTYEWDQITDALDRLDINNPADLAIRGKCRMNARRYDEAIADLEAAVSGGIDEPEVHFELGGALSTMAKIGNLAAAGHIYHKHAAKVDPQDMAEKAIESLRRAVLRLPDSHTATYALCEELEGLGRYNEAMSVLRAYKKFDRGRNRFLYMHAGRIYGSRRKWRLAYTNYVRSVWLLPPKSDASAHVKQKYKQITAMRKRFRDLDHKSYGSFVQMGLELLQAEWHDVAVNAIGTAALMQPSPQLYAIIGEIYKPRMHLNEAIDNYKEGIKRLSGKCTPADLSPLYEELVQTLAKCARFSEVKEYGSEAISLGADSDKLRELWGVVSNLHETIDPLKGGWISPSYLDSSL